MSVLTVILCIWAMVASCAVLFIRGASPRLARAQVMAERRAARMPVTQ
jgi:hypothetical protein